MIPFRQRPCIDNADMRVVQIPPSDVKLSMENTPSKRVHLDVRRAVDGEADRIAQIADAVNIHRYAYLGKGFLVYTLSASEYKKRIYDRQHVYVFIYGKDIIGFVCGYGRKRFESYLSDGTLGHEPTIGREVQRVATERGDKHYAFLDQIAILPEYQDQGLGETFFGKFCQLIDGLYYVAMVEGPLPNPRIAYWRARGFARVGEVFEPLPPRFAETTNSSPGFMQWGIYLLPNKGFIPQDGP